MKIRKLIKEKYTERKIKNLIKDYQQLLNIDPGRRRLLDLHAQAQHALKYNEFYVLVIRIEEEKDDGIHLYYEREHYFSEQERDKRYDELLNKMNNDINI